MKKDEIHFDDINRWLFGNTPPEFMLEVLLRTLIIFFFLLLVVRLMGQRMSGQITITELAVMITIGAIVSPVMQLPDRGILFGIVVLIAALIFQRGLNLLAFKKEKVEHLTQGALSPLIKDGELDLEQLRKTRMSKQQVYSMLRNKKIYNLGQVKRAYLEACGLLSVYTASDAKAGLSIIPQTDNAAQNMQFRLDDAVKACCQCGHVQPVINEQVSCDNCHASEWGDAYINNNL